MIHISHLFVLVANQKNFLEIFAIYFDLHENKSGICLLGNDCQLVCERHSINVTMLVYQNAYDCPFIIGIEMDVEEVKHMILKILIFVKDK